MNKHNYLMALAMNANVGTLHLDNADIPVKITEVESENNGYSSPMTTFKCLVVNDDQIKYRPTDAKAAFEQTVKKFLNSKYGLGGMSAHRCVNPLKIERVIFNAPATIVIWADGTKTVVKCQDGDTYSEETGLALCIAKKALGNQGNYNDIFKQWLPKHDED